MCAGKANALVNLKRFEESLIYYHKALKIVDNAAAHFTLALVYYSLSYFDLAWKHVRAAEKMGIPTQDTNQLIAELRKVSREP
jgi:tetratricopeptide (TPR) repeat protein